MNNMLIRPTEEELKEFGEPDFIIYNASQFPRTVQLSDNFEHIRRDQRQAHGDGDPRY